MSRKRVFFYDNRSNENEGRSRDPWRPMGIDVFPSDMHKKQYKPLKM